MAFETFYMTYNECCQTKRKYSLGRIPYYWYRYDKDNDVYFYMSFGLNYDTPGRFFLIWENHVFRMTAYPADEQWNFLGSGPEKQINIHRIYVPENYDKINMLIDFIEKIFTDFKGNFSDRFTRFSIVNNREQLKRIIEYQNW